MRAYGLSSVCVASGAWTSGSESGCCYVHSVVCDMIQHNEFGFRLPARKGHPFQAFNQGG